MGSFLSVWIYNYFPLKNCPNGNAPKEFLLGFLPLNWFVKILMKNTAMEEELTFKVSSAKSVKGAHHKLFP